jgi:hypothetical protein
MDIFHKCAVTYSLKMAIPTCLFASPAFCACPHHLLFTGPARAIFTPAFLLPGLLLPLLLFTHINFMMFNAKITIEL